MSKKPTISRTLTVSSITVLCVNIETDTTETRSVRLSRSYSSERVLLEHIKEILPDKIRPVYVIEQSVSVKRYTMSEEDFIKNATVVEELKSNTITNR